MNFTDSCGINFTKICGNKVTDYIRTTELCKFKKGLTLAARAEADRLYRLIVITLKNAQELQETLGETPAEADKDSIVNIEKREKETRRYLRVTQTWRNKRREKDGLAKEGELSIRKEEDENSLVDIAN